MCGKHGINTAREWGMAKRAGLKLFTGIRRVLNSEDAAEKWKPSIHMPKEAARIFLRVTSVRAERLQEITAEQATREGIKPDFPPYQIDEFIDIWNSTIKKSDVGRYSWIANPWVWVIEFERCEKPVEYSPW
mgnify:CR=1 FL=1